MGQRWRIGHLRTIYPPIFFFHFVGPPDHAIRCRSPLCPFKGLRDARDKQQSSCQSRPTDETGAPPPKDIRQYLSYFSETALKLLRHLLQFVLISCSCAVASSLKRGAVAHTEREGAFARMHHSTSSRWMPYNLETCTALLRFMKQWHDRSLTRLGLWLGAKHLSTLLAGKWGLTFYNTIVLVGAGAALIHSLK